MAKKSGGKGSKKHGRNKKSCEVYELRGTLEKNKARRAETYKRRVEKKRAKLAAREAKREAEA